MHLTVVASLLLAIMAMEIQQTGSTPRHTTTSFVELAFRMISGRPTTIHKHRHLVYVDCTLIERVPDNAYFGHGALLTLSWVLTAAHVVTWSDQPMKITIKAGVSRLSELNSPNIQVQNTCQRIVHPEYSRPRPYVANLLHNDLALLKMCMPFKTTPTVGALGLNVIPNFHDENQIFSKFSACKMAGFGTVHDPPDDFVDELQEIQVRLVPSQQCLDKGILETPTSIFLCTHSSYAEAYKGDSGTPLMCDGHLLGVCSEAALMAVSQYERHNILARVDVQKGWIVDVVTRNS